MTRENTVRQISDNIYQLPIDEEAYPNGYVEVNSYEITRAEKRARARYKKQLRKRRRIASAISFIVTGISMYSVCSGMTFIIRHFRPEMAEGQFISAIVVMLLASSIVHGCLYSYVKSSIYEDNKYKSRAK